MQKVLTLIIPSYNMEKYLERCLSSLIIDGDRMQLFEALIINDGSKDQTSEIGHQFSERFPDTFRVVDKENGHYGSCVNRGVKEAVGKFVKVLDADDSFDSEVFKEYLSFLSSDDVKESADVVLSDFIEVDDDGVLLSRHPYSDYTNPFTLDQVTPDDTRRWFASGLTYRTSLLQDGNYTQTEGIAYTDVEWIFYPLARVKQVFRFYGNLYRYTKMREGQSVDVSVHGKNVWMESKVVEKLIDSLPSVLEKALPENRRFMSALSYLTITHIYQLYLLTLHKYVTDYAPLKKIDDSLRGQLPLVYEETEKYRTVIAGRPFYPIRDWRQGRSFSLGLQQFMYDVAERKNMYKKKLANKNIG